MKTTNQKFHILLDTFHDIKDSNDGLIQNIIQNSDLFII